MGRKRIIDYLLALVIVISLNFFLPRLLPGDPLLSIYGEDALITMTPEAKVELTRRMGLDKPLWEQFFNYLSGIVKGDLGYSYYFQGPVLDLLLGALPWTLLLTGLALIISTLIGFILGVESGWRKGRLADQGLLTGFMFLNGFPDLVIGLFLLLLFGVVLGLFPLGGAMTPYSQLTGVSLLLDVLHHLFLPLSALVLTEIASCYLLTRTTVVTLLEEPFILTARAKGIKPKNIRYRHVGRNSLLPIVTRTGVRLGRLFTGALFIETIFAYPGMGLLIYRAILGRDFPLIQGVFFLVAVVILLINFFVELIYPRIDPRVKNNAY